MYSIVLKDGKIINIDADEVERFEKTRTLRFYKDRQIVARINMDNVVGWIDADCIEQERRRQKKKIMFDDLSEFAKIEEGRKDIIRTSREYQVGEVIEICYGGFAYNDTVKCKVIGCHKAASDGYIIELINL